MHDKLMEVLTDIELQTCDKRIICNLYWNQTASILNVWYVFSSMLFWVYLEEIFKEALEDIDSGIKINEECIIDIRYAEVFADNLEEVR